jgi:tetratricopeptide (TPR) repeat protein
VLGESINPEASESYLKGEYFLSRMTPDSVRKAADYFQRAIVLDPNYVAALTKLAGCYEILGNMGVVSKRISNPKATTLVSKALEINPQFAPAHAVLGWSLLQYDLDFAGAGAEFKRAVDLAPNAVEGHEGLGDYYATLGQIKPAVEEMEAARALDPVGQIVNYDLCLMLYFARRYDAAISQCKTALDVEPQSVGTLWQLGAVYAARGNDSEAVSAFLQADELSGLPAAMVASLRKRPSGSGLSGLFKASFQFPGLKLEYGQVDSVRLAEAYTYAGNAEKAVTWLERAFEERAYGIIYVGVNPTFDSLRSDPRFVALLRRIGLPPT